MALIDYSNLEHINRIITAFENNLIWIVDNLFNKTLRNDYHIPLSCNLRLLFVDHDKSLFFRVEEILNSNSTICCNDFDDEIAAINNGKFISSFNAYICSVIPPNYLNINN